MNDFTRVIDKYRKLSYSQKDKGSRFERLMQGYLQTDPMYASKFKNVWLWDEFPGRKDLGGGDTGIDLVALTHEGDYWAIQCKCFQEGSTIDKPAVDSFLSTSSRTFKNEELKTTHFAHRLWIETNQASVHKDSGIKNEPNDWSNEVGNPSYIFDLLLSVINVSVQTVDIVDGLPRVRDAMLGV